MNDKEKIKESLLRIRYLIYNLEKTREKLDPHYVNLDKIIEMNEQGIKSLEEIKEVLEDN